MYADYFWKTTALSAHDVETCVRSSPRLWTSMQSQTVALLLSDLSHDLDFAGMYVHILTTLFGLDLIINGCNYVSRNVQANASAQVTTKYIYYIDHPCCLYNSTRRLVCPWTFKCRLV